VFPCSGHASAGSNPVDYWRAVTRWREFLEGFPNRFPRSALEALEEAKTTPAGAPLMAAPDRTSASTNGYGFYFPATIAKRALRKPSQDSRTGVSWRPRRADGSTF